MAQVDVNHTVTIDTLLRTAARLKSEDGSNSEYDRALVEIILEVCPGFTADSYDTIEDAIACRVPNDHLTGWNVTIQRWVKLVQDVDKKPQSYGIIMFENGVEIANLWCPSSEARVRELAELRANPDAYFDAHKQFRNDLDELDVDEGPLPFTSPFLQDTPTVLEWDTVHGLRSVRKIIQKSHRCLLFRQSKGKYAEFPSQEARQYAWDKIRENPDTFFDVYLESMGQDWE